MWTWIKSWFINKDPLEEVNAFLDDIKSQDIRVSIIERAGWRLTDDNSFPDNVVREAQLVTRRNLKTEALIEEKPYDY